MKANICDVCHKDDKIVLSSWRIGRKHGAESIKIDVCEFHKDYFKDCKTVEECRTKASELIG